MPSSFEDLVNLPADHKIVIQDPRSSISGLALVLWVKAVYGDKAADYWTRLSPNILTVTSGWSEAYGLFTEGEADVVLSFNTSPSYHIVAEEDETKKAAILEEGHYPYFELVAKVSSTDVPNLADAFMDFVMSSEFQSIIPFTNWSYLEEVKQVVDVHLAVTGEVTWASFWVVTATWVVGCWIVVESFWVCATHEQARTIIRGRSRVVVHCSCIGTTGQQAAEVTLTVVHVGLHVVVASRSVRTTQDLQLVANAVHVDVVQAIASAVVECVRVGSKFLAVGGKKLLVILGPSPSSEEIFNTLISCPNSFESFSNTSTSGFK